MWHRFHHVVVIGSLAFGGMGNPLAGLDRLGILADQFYQQSSGSLC